MEKIITERDEMATNRQLHAKGASGRGNGGSADTEFSRGRLPPEVDFGRADCKIGMRVILSSYDTLSALAAAQARLKAVPSLLPLVGGLLGDADSLVRWRAAGLIWREADAGRDVSGVRGSVESAAGNRTYGDAAFILKLSLDARTDAKK